MLAMKYLAVPMRVESASSGSTAAECFCLDPNKFRGHISLCALEHSESVCCFGFVFWGGGGEQELSVQCEKSVRLKDDRCLVHLARNIEM